MEQKPRVDHVGEVIRIIDHILAEESIVLDGLKKAVEQNAISEEDAIMRFNVYRQHFRRDPDDVA